MPPLRLVNISTRASAIIAQPFQEQAVAKIATDTRNAAEAPELAADASAELREELEMAFLSGSLFEDLLAAVQYAPLWPLVHSLIQRRFQSTIQVPSNTDFPGQLSRRVGLALIRRLEALELTEIPNASEEYSLQHEALQARRLAHRTHLASDRGHQSAETVNNASGAGANPEPERSTRSS